MIAATPAPECRACVAPIDEVKEQMKRILKLGLVGLVVLGLPAAAVAHGPEDAAKGLAIAVQHAVGNVPTLVGGGRPEGVGAGKPETSGQPEDTGQPTDNHGWFVSQVAKDHSTTGQAHGDAVKTVATSDQGLPEGATNHP